MRQVSMGRRYVAASSGYVGPGDVATFNLWWGVRAYTAAKAAALAAAIQVVDTSGLNSTDIHLTSSGDLNMGELNTFFNAHGQPIINILYDQTGGSNDSAAILGVDKNVVWTNMGTGVDPSSLYILMGATTFRARNSGTISVTQPYLIYGVAYNTSDIDNGISGSNSTTDVRLSFRPTLHGGIYAGGTDLIATANTITLNSWHVIQGIYNGDSSIVDADNVSGSDGVGGGGKPGSQGLSDFCTFGAQGNAMAAGSRWRETGLISGLTVINSVVNSNAKTYWGF